MVSRKHRPRKRRPQTTDLENADLENTDLENTDLENADLANKDLENTNVSQTLSKITAFARERIMAAMNLNPLVSLFFFFCYLLFCFQFFQICFQYPKLIMKGVIGPKYQLISQRRKAQIVM